MEIKQVERTVDGKLNVLMVLEPEQIRFLLNLAIGILVAKGAVSFTKLTEEQFNKMQHDEATEEAIKAFSDIMNNADPDDLPQA